MRAAHRLLALVPAVLLSVVAVPAQAGDDSPGLLETLGGTVDTVTSPILKPNAAPVGQLTSVVDAALGTKLSRQPVVAKVDAIVRGQASTPTGALEPPTAPVVKSPVRELATPAAVAASQRVVTVRPLLSSFATAAVARPRAGVPVTADEVHVPRTSTLPDGGSPMSLAWLTLAFGTTALGVLVIRRSRTA